MLFYFLSPVDYIHEIDLVPVRRSSLILGNMARHDPLLLDIPHFPLPVTLPECIGRWELDDSNILYLLQLYGFASFKVCVYMLCLTPDHLRM